MCLIKCVIVPKINEKNELLIKAATRNKSNLKAEILIISVIN